MAFTNEGRAAAIQVWNAALQNATFRIGNSPTPVAERETDTGNGGNQGMTGNATSVLSFSRITTKVEGDCIKVNCIVEEAEANGETWTEIGLFWPSGHMITREIISVPEEKNTAKKLFYTFQLDFYI